MPLWKITEKRPSKVKEAKIKQEKLLEEHLEDWIAAESGTFSEEAQLVFKGKSSGERLNFGNDHIVALHS